MLVYVSSGEMRSRDGVCCAMGLISSRGTFYGETASLGAATGDPTISSNQWAQSLRMTRGELRGTWQRRRQQVEASGSSVALLPVTAGRVCRRAELDVAAHVPHAAVIARGGARRHRCALAIIESRVSSRFRARHNSRSARAVHPRGFDAHYSRGCARSAHRRGARSPFCHSRGAGCSSRTPMVERSDALIA